jgi:tetratricopeptide (TPR) repeat protein
MRLMFWPLLTASVFLIFATQIAISQTEIPMPMQVCTPISTGDCAQSPHWLQSPRIKSSGKSGGSWPEGQVGLNLVVGADGSVHDVEVVHSSDELLKEDVIASAPHWKLVPATFQGRAVPAEVRVVVQFFAVGNPGMSLGPWRASWTTVGDLQKLCDEAYQASARHDYQKTIALSRQLLALEPLYKRVRLVMGDSLVELQQYEDAEAVLQEEIKLDPKSPYVYNTLGWAYQRHRKYDEAIAQFKKQIEVTPEAFNPHANLGELLCARKRCSEAMPELEKALAISPEQSRALLAEGKCNIDLGNTAKGISEMEQAANLSASSESWDQAAYRLAERNVELDQAKKWAETAITIKSAFLRDLSLDHATPSQFGSANAISSYWDTLGWVYFRMGKDDLALGYIDAAWRMHPTPTKGDHQGQIYEKVGRREDAIRAYSMAVASADLSKRGASSPEDLAEAKNRLTQMAGQGADIAALIERGHSDLEGLRMVTVENAAKRTGSADFIMKVVGDKIVDVRQVSGDAGFAPFSEALRKSSLPVKVPERTGVEILRRGTLSCKMEADECHFKLIGTEEAADLATQEADAAKAKIAN